MSSMLPYFYLILFICLPVLSAEPVNFNARAILNYDEIELGDTLKLRLEIDWESSASNVLITSLGSSQIKNLDFVTKSTANGVKKVADDKKYWQRFEYIWVAKNLGQASFDDLKVYAIVEGQQSQIEFEAPLVKIVSPPEPIKLWVYSSPVLIVLLGMGIWKWRKKKTPSALPEYDWQGELEVLQSRLSKIESREWMNQAKSFLELWAQSRGTQSWTDLFNQFEKEGSTLAEEWQGRFQDSNFGKTWKTYELREAFQKLQKIVNEIEEIK